MLGGLSVGNVEISNFLKVMHILDGAGISLIHKGSAVLDDSCSMSSAGVGAAGGLSAGGSRAVARCDGGHGGRMFKRGWCG